MQVILLVRIHAAANTTLPVWILLVTSGTCQTAHCVVGTFPCYVVSHPSQTAHLCHRSMPYLVLVYTVQSESTCHINQ